MTGIAASAALLPARWPRISRPVVRSGFVWGVASVLFVLLAWWGACAGGLVSSTVLPGPAEILRTFALLLDNGYGGTPLTTHLTASLTRLGVAFIVTAAIGVPLGLAMGSSKMIREVIDPWVKLYKPVPSLAYMGLLIIWLGVGDTSRIALLALGGLPAIMIGTTDAVGSVRRDRIEGARSLGIDGLGLFRTIILPSCLPGILVSLRIASSGIFTTLIAAEMMGANTGLGSMLLAASYQMDMGVVIVAVLIMGCAGIAIDQLFRWLRRRFVPWAGLA